MDEEIDYRFYVTPTRFSHAVGIVLVIQLLRAAFSRPSGAVRAALDKLREAAVHAQNVAVERLAATPEALRPFDIRLDNGIVGLREVLEGKARLTGTPVGERAAKLVTTLFPLGTGFVQAKLPEEWAAVKTHLERIDRDALAAEIDAIAGPEFLPFIRAAHEELGERLGVGDTALAAPHTTALRESNQRLAKAIANYGRAMVATVNEDDPESVAAFKRAMYPLDAYRRTAFANAGSGGTDEDVVLDPDIEPTDPIPPVPSDPEVDPEVDTDADPSEPTPTA